MSAIKEPHYFAGPPGKVPFGTPQVARLGDYRALFDPRAAVRGEASPSYAAYPRRTEVAQRIRELVPDARMIYLVRDPVERTVSHYRHRVAVEGERRPIDEALGDLEAANVYVCASRYATQLDQYLAVFPTSRMLVVEQGQLRRDRAETLRRVFSFLGVASDFSSDGFARQYRGSDAGRRYPYCYRTALMLAEKTPLGLLPPTARRRLRARVERAILPALPDVTLGAGLHARLTGVLGPEAERFRRLTGLQTPTWCL